VELFGGGSFDSDGGGTIWVVARDAQLLACSLGERLKLECGTEWEVGQNRGGSGRRGWPHGSSLVLLMQTPGNAQPRVSAEADGYCLDVDYRVSSVSLSLAQPGSALLSAIVSALGGMIGIPQTGIGSRTSWHFSTFDTALQGSALTDATCSGVRWRTAGEAPQLAQATPHWPPHALLL
jgi:hypothetical protein